MPPLAGWSVICLRPASQQAAARAATRQRGGRHVALPGIALAVMPDQKAARAALDQALACPVLVFTSPAAVAFAAHLRPLRDTTRAKIFTVGAGTTRALARHGLQATMPPPDAMHSDGLLALDAWHKAGGAVGLVTAPGGRGMIAAALAAQGRTVRRADVYQRQAPRLDRRHFKALDAADSPRALLVSSGEALQGVLAALPEEQRAIILDSLAVASSPRLAELARDRGFSGVITASAPTNRAMLDALELHAGTAGFR